MTAENTLRVLKWVFGCMGLTFLLTGVGLFIGLTLPESRSLRAAANEAYPLRTAVYTDYIRTHVRVNGEARYRLRFVWNGHAANTNAVYTYREAVARLGEEIQVRVTDTDRAVPVDFRRSVNSTLGYVFLGVLGGIGALFLITLFIVRTAHARRREETNPYATHI